LKPTIAKNDTTIDPWFTNSHLLWWTKGQLLYRFLQ